MLNNLSSDNVQNFFVFGGECNYLLRCSLGKSRDGSGESAAILIPMLPEEWQADDLNCPNPYKWDKDEVELLLNIAERSMRSTCAALNLRAKILRKDRAVGVFPGGDEMCELVPKGHGSKKLKLEALEELVLRVMDSFRKQTNPIITLPFCVFNGGRDAWFDVGNKSVAVEVLQAFFKFKPQECLHVGDQVNLVNFISCGSE